MLEFALCLPVMLLIVTGVMSFGITMNQYLMVTNSTNSGARALAVSRGLTTDPCTLARTNVTNAAPLLTSANLTYTLVLNGTTYSGKGSGFACDSGSINSGAAANLAQNTNAKLTVTYPCTLQVYGKNIIPNCNLLAQDAELVQ